MHWSIRSNRNYYAQGPNPRWYSNSDFATHFRTEDDARTEARDVLGFADGDYEVDIVYPQTPRLPNGGQPFRRG